MKHTTWLWIAAVLAAPLTGLIVLGFMLVLRAWWSVRQDRAEMAAEAMRNRD